MYPLPKELQGSKRASWGTDAVAPRITLDLELGEHLLSRADASVASAIKAMAMEAFTFATSTQVDFPIHVKMYVE